MKMLTGFFYEEYCLSQVFCMIDHLIIQLAYPEFHFETGLMLIVSLAYNDIKVTTSFKQQYSQQC